MKSQKFIPKEKKISIMQRRIYAASDGGVGITL